MSTETNKAIVHRYVEEGFNANNMAVYDELLAANFVYHDPGMPAVRTLQQLKEFHRGEHAAFPDIHVTVEDEIADGDKLVQRWTLRGTHRGDLIEPQGVIPPTGKQVQVSGISILRLAGGKMVEQWIHGDNLGFLQQLGLIPAPKPAGHEPGA